MVVRLPTMLNEAQTLSRSAIKTILHGHSIHNGLVSVEELGRLLDLPYEGIELDVRSYKGIPVVAHDSGDAKRGASLGEMLPLVARSDKVLLLELKEYNRGLWDAVIRSVLEHHLESRTTLFAFPRIARKFPWQEKQSVALGIIEPFPWRITRVAEALHPEMIVVGWGSDWERFTFSLERAIFKIAWSITARFSRFKTLPLKIVVGALRSEKDLAWAARQAAFFGGLCDQPSGEQPQSGSAWFRGKL